MVRKRFSGSNVNEGDYQGISISDNSQARLRQSRDYIEGLKELRDQTTAVNTALVSEYEKTLEKGAKWKTDVNETKIQAAKTLATQQQAQLRRQQRATESITGRKANIDGSDSKVDGWLNFVTGISGKAKEMIETSQQEQADFSWDQATVKASMFGMTKEQVAWQRQWDNADIMSANQRTLAAAAEASGADPEYVEYLRSMDAHGLNATRHALATQAGSQAVPKFQTALTQDAETLVTVIRNGEKVEIPLREINQADPKEITAAWTQWLPEYYKKNGYADASHEFLYDGLEKANEGFEKFIGEKQQAKISQNNTERIDGALTGLRSYKDPKTAQAYYNMLITTGTMPPSKARAEMLKELQSLNYSDDEVNAILKSQFPGMDKTIEEQFGAEVLDLKDVRKKAIEDKVRSTLATKDLQEKLEIEKFEELVIKDLEGDNDVDLSNEQLQKMAADARAKGYENLAKVIESKVEFTQNTKRDEEIVRGWADQLQQGGFLTPQEIWSSDASKSVKREWLKKAQESNEKAIPKESRQNANQIIKQALSNRAGLDFSKSSKQDTSVLNAIHNAEAQFAIDYANFMSRRDATHGAAYDYALGRFQDELNNEKTGLYAVGEIKPGAMAYPNFAIKATTPVEYGYGEIRKAFETKNVKEVLTSAVTDYDTMKKVADSFQQQGTFQMPGEIRYMVEATGGKVSAKDILNMQLKAHDLPQIPDELYRRTQETEESFGDYQEWLQSYPSRIRTDVAAIGSGQEPVYQQVSPMARQAMDIVGKYESDSVGGYNAMNSGVDMQGNIQGYSGPSTDSRGLGKELTSMTLGEILELQKDPNGLFAVGRYQFTNHVGTLEAAMAATGITADMKFTPQVQDQLFLAHFDKHGYQPWDGPRLHATQPELDILNNFQRTFTYERPTWRQANNMNPKLVYRIGSLGYGSTGPHLDVKPVLKGGIYGDRSLDNRYIKGTLDKFVLVKTADGKLVPLSEGTITTDDDAAHRARSSYGHDYATPGGESGQEVYLTNGAKIVENWVDNSAEGQGSNRMVIELPDGRRFAFVHGTGVN